MTETAESRLRSAMDELNAQEDYVRSMRHLSDDQLREQIVDALRQEKVTIAGWLDSGDCFIIAGSGKVHLPSCPSMRQFMDRDAAWAPYLDDLERVRNWHGDDNAPAFPTLRTRADIESLRSYRICPTCAPTLDHTDKRNGVKGWTVLKAGSLNRKHLGTSFSMVDGTEIGALTKLATVETLDGTDFHADFDGLDHPVTDPAIAMMYRTGTRPQPS